MQGSKIHDVSRDRVVGDNPPTTSSKQSPLLNMLLQGRFVITNHLFNGSNGTFYSAIDLQMQNKSLVIQISNDQGSVWEEFSLLNRISQTHGQSVDGA